MESKQQAEALAEQYFAAATEGNAASILEMYDDAFYKATPEGRWRETCERVRTKLGKPKVHTLSNWAVNNIVGSGGNGAYVTLVYQVEYEKENGSETIGVFMPAATHRPGIRAHNFASNALLQ